jgi:hypothetical protein
MLLDEKGFYRVRVVLKDCSKMKKDWNKTLKVQEVAKCVSL